MFDMAELKSLKAELNCSKPIEVYGGTETEKPKDAVGFRLDPYYVELLREQGERHGMSPGEWARRLVIRSLEDTSVNQYRDELHALREALADTFHAFLTLKCGVSSDDATLFVKETILRGPA